MKPKQLFSMKSILTLLITLLFCSTLISQRYERMEDNEDSIHENLSATYNARFVKNRKTQDVYDIEVSVRNNSYDMIVLKQNIGEAEFSLKKYAIAECRFENATGSNLTVKDGNILGKEIQKDVLYECAKCNGDDDETVNKKDRFVIGYGIRRGEIINESFRVRVPKDEKPEVDIRFLNR